MPDENSVNPRGFWAIATAVGTLATAACLPVLTFINSSIKDRLDHQNAVLESEFAHSGKRVEQTQNLFDHLSKGAPEEKRLAVLLALAYAQEGQIPEFVLPVLAIHESKDTEISAYLLSGLDELRFDASKESVRLAAARAFAMLLASTNDNANTEAAKAKQQKVANVAMQLSETINSSAKGDSSNSAQAQAALAVLAPSLANIAVTSGNANAKQQAVQALGNVTPANVEQAINQLPDQVQKMAPWRVYLHVANASQIELARAIERKLTEKGYLVPGIQNLDGTRAYIPDDTEVRCFAVAARPNAQSILDLFKGAISNTDHARVSYTTAGPKENPEHFEIWFSKKAFN